MHAYIDIPYHLFFYLTNYISSLMKKIVLSLLMLAGLSSASYAQGIIGPKVGMSFSNAKDTKTPDTTQALSYGSIITPQLGIVFNARLGDYVTNLAGAWDTGSISATISGHASMSGEPDSLSIQLTRIE